MSLNVLVVAAHPDDEALGCGGTIARHTGLNDNVDVLFLADGETSRGEQADIAKRNSAAEAAAKELGVRSVKYLGFPDNQLDTLPLLSVTQAIEKILRTANPQIIYTHHGGDLNIDHRITHQAVLTACRPIPGTKVTAIYGFETASSTEWASPETAPGFRPTRFVDITTHLEQKLAALKCYENEMHPFPHARSYDAIKHQAHLRGASVGLEAAEAFSVIREIVT